MTEEQIQRFNEEPKSPDICIRTALKNYQWEKPQTSLDQVIEWLYVDFELGDTPEQSSVLNNVVEEFALIDHGDIFHFTQDKRGLAAIPKHIYS